MAAPQLGKSWDRFISNSLGSWTGRCLSVSPEGNLLSSLAYTLSTTGIKPTRSNPSSVLVSATLTAANSAPTSLDLRYDTSSLYVFPDGSFTSTHRLQSLAPLLPAPAAADLCIEHVLILSATERVRAFANYATDGTLLSVVLLEEVRADLFENRDPLSLTALLGEWGGEAEALQRPRGGGGGGSGFGGGAGIGEANAAAKSAARYSKDDLPDALQHPSRSAAEGLVRFRTKVGYQWDPAAGRLRRTTALADLQGEELGASTVYGKVEAAEGALFDVVNCSDETFLFTLSNSCFLSVPARRGKGSVTTSELGCLVTPHCRRRIQRTNAKWGVASESLVTESRVTAQSRVAAG